MVCTAMLCWLFGRISHDQSHEGLQSFSSDLYEKIKEEVQMSRFGIEKLKPSSVVARALGSGESYLLKSFAACMGGMCPVGMYFVFTIAIAMLASKA